MSDSTQNQLPFIEIGILTKGKPTLGMVLVSLLLQRFKAIRIEVVDTGDTAAIKRDDVMFALRLAFDLGIICNYRYLKEKERAFSLGRLKLLESMKGNHICFMDDDVVVSADTLAQVAPSLENGVYGFVAPRCKNAWFPAGFSQGRPHYSPGGVLYQDEIVRQILTEYYSTTVDVLDRQASPEKVWEIAFLTEMFHALGRPCAVQEDNLTYHLDYHERPNWGLDEEYLIQRSVRKARELAAKFGNEATT
jgi:hypothetical protein